MITWRAINHFYIKVMRSSDGIVMVVYLANPTVFEGHAPNEFEGVHTDAEAMGTIRIAFRH